MVEKNDSISKQWFDEIIASFDESFVKKLNAIITQPSSRDKVSFTIKEHLATTRNQKTLDTIPDFLEFLHLIAKSNPHNEELFFTFLDSISIAVKKFHVHQNIAYLNELIDYSLILLEEYQNKEDFLLGINDICIEILDILQYYDLITIFEKYLKRLLKNAVTKKNFLFQTLAMDGLISAIQTFGNSWNYSKTKRYSKLLYQFYETHKNNPLIYGLYLKGLSEEIHYYTEMNEFNTMIESLNGLKTLYETIADRNLQLSEDYAKGLRYAIIGFGDNEKTSDMLALLDELKQLEKKYTNSTVIKFITVQAFQDVLNSLTLMEKPDIAKQLMNELLKFTEKNLIELEIQKTIIEAFFNTSSWLFEYYKKDDFLGLLEKIRSIPSNNLHNSQIQDYYARGLLTLTKNMNANADKEIREFVENEFYLLHKRNPNNVELSVLYSKILELHILLSSSLENGCKHILTLLSRAEELVEKYPDHFEIINNFSSILVNSIQKLSQEKKIDEMINLLGTLKEYYLIFDNLDLLVQLANVYHTIIRTYGSLKKYEKQISFLKEFKEWIANDQFEIEIHIFYCKALFSTIKTLESLNKIGLSEYYLDELGEIADNFHATNNIQESYAKSLSLSIKWRLEYNANSDIIIKKFKQLYALQKEFSENDEILLAYAKAIRFMLINIDVLDLPELISTLLDNLKTLDAEYADKPVIQNEIALSYSGIILSNTLIWDDVIKDEILKEFNHLMERNPENEKLFDIYQNITPYLKKGKFS